MNSAYVHIEDVELTGSTDVAEKITITTNEKIIIYQIAFGNIISYDEKIRSSIDKQQP